MDTRLCLFLSLAIFFLILLSGLFSASETSFASLNKYKYKVEAEEGSKKAKLVCYFYERFDLTLVSVLVGNNIVNIGMSTIATSLFLVWMANTIDSFFISLIASISMTIIVYFLGESLPKVLAKKNPEKMIELTLYPMALFYFVLFPVNWLFYQFDKFTMRLFKAKDKPMVGEEDFSATINELEKVGVLEENESDIIQNTLDFDDTSVKEVLTPKKKMTMIDLKGLSKDRLLQLLKETSFSRIPVYYEDTNKIIGILIVKNYLTAYFENPSVSLRSTLEKPYFVTPKIKIDDLIEGFRSRHTQIAIVRSQGEVLGMVTSEDVLEELVGPIDEEVEA